MRHDSVGESDPKLFRVKRRDDARDLRQVLLALDLQRRNGDVNRMDLIRIGEGARDLLGHQSIEAVEADL